ncbi:MAG: AAA family ATPase [Thermodesulfobacteriota bacterium]
MEHDGNMEKQSNEEQRIPSQKELEKELSDYLSKKYGDRIKIVSPMLFPQGDLSKTEDGGQDAQKKNDGPVFDMKPEELEAYLHGYVIKQDRAKGVLSTKICTHFNRLQSLGGQFHKEKYFSVGMIKNNILMIGPTGVGKTYLIKLIAQKIGVPFIKGDATKFSETGYVGGDVEDLVRDLVYEAKDDIQLAENGIVYIDEIDKIASCQNIIGHDVSRTGVQRALLKPMEETDVELKVPHDPISQIQAIEQYRKTGKREKQVVNTKNILFIMSGAFEGLAEIIKKRLRRQGIGFEADIQSSEVDVDILKHVRAQDLIEFGFESEFIGRLPVIVVFDELTKDDLVQILKNPNNPIILSKKRDFMSYGINLKFEDSALEEIAEMASHEKTGARGLVSAVERVLMPFEKHLPSTTIDKLLVTPQLVKNQEQELVRLESPDRDESKTSRQFKRAAEHEKKEVKETIKQKAGDLESKLGLKLSEDRIDLIAELILRSIFDIDSGLSEFKEMSSLVAMQIEGLLSHLGIKVSLSDSAVDEIIRLSVDEDRELGEVCLKLANELEYGLKLVRDKIGSDVFIITGESVLDPEKYIDGLIKKYYSQDQTTS